MQPHKDFVMNFIVFTKNMDTYDSAYYQKCFLDELKNQVNTFFYSHDYDCYNKNFKINDILQLASFNKDNTILLFSHSWLNDASDTPICIDQEDYYDNDIPKVLILNKEYARLNEKLNWAKENRMNLIFTHHTDKEKIQTLSSIKTIFWPFAVDPKIFTPSKLPINKKRYDLSYSGILQNLNVSRDTQTDQRVKVLKELYYLYKKKKIHKKN
jgi:hypothetical protein